jgi:uncharacterized membrane protein
MIIPMYIYTSMHVSVYSLLAVLLLCLDHRAQQLSSNAAVLLSAFDTHTK